MATIEVSYREAEGDDFPTMCMRCGSDTEELVGKTFYWNPGWAHFFFLLGLLPWLIAVVVTRKTMRMSVPLCSEHLKHWQSRALYTWLGFFLLVGLWICVAVIASQFQLPQTALMIAILACMACTLIWLIAAVIISQNAIRPSRIDNFGIELVNVNKHFQREWEMICEEADRRRSARKKSRSKREDWDDEDE
jgi:hypothetical protein